MPPPSTSIDFRWAQEGKSCSMQAISFEANGERIDSYTKPVIKSVHLGGRGLELQDVKEAQVLQHSASLDSAMSELRKGFKKRIAGGERVREHDGDEQRWTG